MGKLVLITAKSIELRSLSCYRHQTRDPWPRLRNSDGWRDFSGRLFRTRSVMGRLWDDHFRDLGHPPKFSRVLDAGFIGGFPIWWQIIIIFEQNHWKIIKKHVFLQKWHKKKKTAGKLATEVRAGDAPKPKFSMETDEKSKKSGNQPPVNHTNFALFLSLP